MFKLFDLFNQQNHKDEIFKSELFFGSFFFALKVYFLKIIHKNMSENLGEWLEGKTN